MIFVGKRTAGHAGGEKARLSHQRNRCAVVRRVEAVVPHRKVDAEMPAVGGLDCLRGVDADVDECRDGNGCQRDVIQVKSSGRAVASQLNVNAMEVGHVGDAECRERNGKLLPGVSRQQHWQRVSRPGAAPVLGIHLQALSAGAAAVRPERESEDGAVLKAE